MTCSSYDRNCPSIGGNGKRKAWELWEKGIAMTLSPLTSFSFVDVFEK